MVQKRIVRQLRGGQITIPKAFREALGIDEDALLEAVLDGDTLTLRRAEVVDYSHNSRMLKELYDLFAPTREALADWTEDDINAAVDGAVAEARAEIRARRAAEHRQAS